MKISLVMALTVDGMIARDENQLANWTSREDKKLFAALTKEAGVVIMGRKTFATFPKALPGRLNVVLTRQNLKSKSNDLFYTSKSPCEIKAELENRGYKKAILGGGAKINSLFLKEELIDELILTIEPKVFGQGINLFSEGVNLNLTLLEHKLLNKNSIMLRYIINYE